MKTEKCDFGVEEDGLCPYWENGFCIGGYDKNKNDEYSYCYEEEDDDEEEDYEDD